MPEIREYTVYRFDELSDAAKEKARDWFRSCYGEVEDFSAVIDDANTIAAILGIEIETRPVKLMGGGTRYDPCIWYSLSYSQGDGACFEGRYSYAKGSVRKLKEHAPQDTELYRIAEGLRDIQRRHFYRLEARVSHRGNYTHPRSTEIEVTSAETGDYVAAEIAETVAELLRDFMGWIYVQLREEYEYQTADEQVDEAIRANEYTFTEDGKRRD